MKHDLVFVTAQPDVPYFHWQVKVYSYNFIEMGINPNQIHVIFSMVNGVTEPTKESLELKSMGINVHHYVDNRQQKHYIPNIKPFLIHKWLEQFPQFGKSRRHCIASGRRASAARLSASGLSTACCRGVVVALDLARFVAHAHG